MGQPKPPGTAVQVRGAHAGNMPAGIVNGDLDGVGVRSQFQCAAAPTVAQGIGDELGHDQDPSVRRVTSHGRLLQTFEEGPCRIACVGNGCGGTDGCGAGSHRDHQGRRMTAPAAVSPCLRSPRTALDESEAVSVRHQLLDHPGIVEGGAGPSATLVNGRPGGVTAGNVRAGRWCSRETQCWPVPPTVAAAQAAMSRPARHATRWWVTVSAGQSLAAA
jgi:hypothetical protein